MILLLPDLTIQATAAPIVTLRMVTIVLACGTVVLWPSLAYLFYIFKRPEF